MVKTNQFLILVSIVLVGGGLTEAFVPAIAPTTRVTTHLDMSTRRDVLGSIILGAGAAMMPVKSASAFSQQLPDNAFEPQQQATDGKLDLNAAFVVSHDSRTSLCQQHQS